MNFHAKFLEGRLTMGAFRPWHWIVIIVLLILLFGANKLPEIAGSLGKSMKVLKKEVKELKEEDAPAQKQATDRSSGGYLLHPAFPASGRS